MTRAGLAALGAIAALGACIDGGGAADRLPESAPDLARATAEVFGDRDPAETVATVGAATISVGDVAAYLRLFPTLTVEQAVEDLADLHAVEQAAPAAALEQAAPARTDARRDALTYGWLHHTVWDDPSLQEPPPDEVAAWRDDPERSAPFGSPELLRVSHLLVQLPEDASDADVAEVEAQLRESRQRLLALGRPPAAFDLIEERDRLREIVDDRLPDEEDVEVETHFAFPRVPSGPARWTGADAVVPEFSDAAWPLEPHELSQPVRTSFGLHLILAEERIDAYFVPDDQRARMAEEFALARVRSAAFNERFGPIMQRMTVYPNTENIGILSMSAEERLAAEAQSQSDRFDQGEGP